MKVVEPSCIEYNKENEEDRQRISWTGWQWFTSWKKTLTQLPSHITTPSDDIERRDPEDHTKHGGGGGDKDIGDGLIPTHFAQKSQPYHPTLKLEAYPKTCRRVIDEELHPAIFLNQHVGPSELVYWP